MVSASISTPVTGITSAHAGNKARKRKRYECGFGITGLSSYYVLEHQCSNCHKKAVGRFMKLPCLAQTASFIHSLTHSIPTIPSCEAT